jgi:hypothetical protein
METKEFCFGENERMAKKTSRNSDPQTDGLRVAVKHPKPCILRLYAAELILCPASLSAFLAWVFLFCLSVLFLPLSSRTPFYLSLFLILYHTQTHTRTHTHTHTLSLSLRYSS